MRKAHGQKGTVRGYQLDKAFECYLDSRTKGEIIGSK